ncbi:MAG: molecular chaperone HtpG [Alphaproteobacteria bacterium]|nr:molecular chaperone HtpG [Alphaproteobacteria bacterium]
MAKAEAQKTEKKSFQAEVSRLLQIVANSLYSDRDVFLRELISNASDACDKLRYEAITAPSLIEGDPEFQIVLEVDKSGGILRIMDNGIGMSREELTENLGTIAKSGTAAFVEQLQSGDKNDKAGSMIGQFGVGFYSAFMVSDQVVVESRRADGTEGWRWESDGLGEYTIGPCERGTRGTTVTLHIKKDAKDYLKPATLRGIVKKHSDHIGIPVVMKGDGDAEETLNDASALWTRPKSEIEDAQYTEFYHHVSNNFDDPTLTLHARVEGKIDYTLLLFVPSVRPFDIFDPARQHNVRLYVKRVFVTSEMEGLIPPYLRFLCGIVDTEDLSLNVSREMLQTSPLIAKIRKDIVKKTFRELKKLSTKEAEKFEGFWNEFGAVLKEGLYEDPTNKDDILAIARFKTTGAEKSTTLADYVSRMKEDQKSIYYIVGDGGSIERSPQLEGFKARGIEVLLLSDPVDDFWVNSLGTFEDTPFKSVTRGAADLKDASAENDAGKTDDAKADEDDVPTARLVALLKLALKDRAQDVRTTDRLTDSPACIVAADDGLDMHTERLLRQHGRITEGTLRVLEINPKHSVVTALTTLAASDNATARLEEAAHLLFDQATILEGELPPDIGAFSSRLVSLLEKAVRLPD